MTVKSKYLKKVSRHSFDLTVIECFKTQAKKKDIIFWYFPMLSETRQTVDREDDDIISEFRKLTLEPMR